MTKMSGNDVPNFIYGEEDLIYSSPTWKEFKTDPKLSKFDLLLGSRWEDAMSKGAFNYTLSKADMQTRVVPGKQKYYIALSLKRAQKRRQPEFIDKVNKPFEPNKFHFNKVKTCEVVMNLCPNEHDASESDQNTTCPVVNGDTTDCKMKTLSGPHKIIINVSPFDYGHVLLTPDVEECINQRVTLRGMQLSIHMLLLSQHPGLRIGFNGLCALASVNHQHVHGWYLDTQLKVEDAAVKHLHGLCYEMTDITSGGFVFQLHGTTVEKMVKAVFAVTNYFQENDIAHNMFLTRGVAFGESADSEKTTIRAIVWARKHYIGDKSSTEANSAVTGVFNVAVAELAGHIPMYYPDRFDDLTEAEIDERIQESLLSEAELDQIRQAIKGLKDDAEKSF